MRQCLVALFNYGLFERFPEVEVVVLEFQAGWFGYLLDRTDAVFDVPLSHSTQLKEPPRNYFRRQCRISADPGDKSPEQRVDARRVSTLQRNISSLLVGERYKRSRVLILSVPSRPTALV